MVQEPQPATQTEEELPIDIDYAKFLDWLVDRRRIPRDWHSYLKAARALVRNAISLTPESAREHLSIDLPSPTSSPLHYFQAVDILAALTAADAPAEWNGGPDKDLLGRPKGATARAWADAVAAFQKKHVYLADCAQLLSRNADLEAPAIKATVARLHADVAEYTHRDGPAVRAAADAHDRFRVACEEFELPEQGEVDYQKLLADAVAKRVPELLAEAVAHAKGESFTRAVEHYERFARHVQRDGDGATEGLLETAHLVIDGDLEALIRPVRKVTEPVGDLDMGVDGDMSVGEVSVSPSGQGGGEATEVDWGIEIGESGTCMEINEAPSQTEGDGDACDSSPVAEAGRIDWNSAAFGESGVDPTEIIDEDENAFTLADPKSRELYLNDLVELDAFLAQRVAELSRAGNTEVGLVMQQASDTPDFVKATDSEVLKMFQGSVQQAIATVNSSETRRLLALQSDEKRLERAARAVVEKKHAAERMHAVIDVLRKRRESAVTELASETPRLEKLGKITRDVKKRTEEALSVLYKGRTVNILGEINNVFPPID